MADLDVGAGALGSRLSVHLKAVPPFGWVGVVALVAVIGLTWASWKHDDDDSTDWTDPEQPPENVSTAPLRVSTPTSTRQLPSWNGAALRGRRDGSPIPGAV